LKATIIDAVRNVNADIALVLLAGLFGVQFEPDDVAWLHLVGLGASLLLWIVVCGRIVARVRGAQQPSSAKILKDHGVNYLVVTLLLVMPVLLFEHLVKLASPSFWSFLLSQMGWRALVDAATIYVMPVVFLKGKGAVAVPVGIALLMHRLKESLFLVGVVAVIFVVDLATLAEFSRVWSPDADIHDFTPLWAARGVAVTYLSFVVFAGAVGMLVREQGRASGLPLSGSDE